MDYFGESRSLEQELGDRREFLRAVRELLGDLDASQVDPLQTSAELEHDHLWLYIPHRSENFAITVQLVSAELEEIYVFAGPKGGEPILHTAFGSEREQAVDFIRALLRGDVERDVTVGKSDRWFVAKLFVRKEGGERVLFGTEVSGLPILRRRGRTRTEQLPSFL